MKLPLLISIPHTGLAVPPEIEPYCLLTEDEIIADSDGGAIAIYKLKEEVQLFQTTEIARAIVDLNRAEDDRRPDGVVKTHTIYGAKVYGLFPSEDLVQVLLDKYYRPYHQALSKGAGNVMLGIDCHSMAAKAPPMDAESGTERPLISIADNEGKSLPPAWRDRMKDCLEDAFGLPVAVNQPFKGGYITKVHSSEMPWLQLELSRADFYSLKEKRQRLLQALTRFCEHA